jgi:serine/threonine protein phosphatase PrpC
MVSNSGTATLQGARNSQEDCTASVTVADVALFGVFDGHGGKETAEYCAENLASSFAAAHRGCRTTKGSGRIERSLHDAILALAAATANHLLVGTTANVVAINRSYIICANVGDSRAILLRVGGVGSPLSNDHKVSSSVTERARLENAGVHEKGYMDDVYVYVNRQMGLAVTRSIGDTFFRHVGVIATPEIRTVRRSPEDRLVVMASDGVWDAMSSDEVAAFVWNEWGQLDRDQSDWCTVIAERLVAQAIFCGSRDNVTAQVVALSLSF